MAMSSRPICEGPSSPIDTPACEPTNLMFAAEYWLMRIWSNARVQNAEKVEANGTLPRQDNPKATLAMFCSAIYISKNRSGCSSLNRSARVELLTSPSRLTICGYLGNRRFSALP